MGIKLEFFGLSCTAYLQMYDLDLRMIHSLHISPQKVPKVDVTWMVCEGSCVTLFATLVYLLTYDVVSHLIPLTASKWQQVLEAELISTRD